MTILITGGTGKTGLKLARLLHEAKHSILLASRSGKVPAPFHGVAFDWFNPSTYENPFNAVTPDNAIDSMYLVGPSVQIDYLGNMRAFINLAKAKGVKRFVMMSASSYVSGSPAMGKVHEYLEGLGVDYCILRPTWFQENFTELYLNTIRHDNAIVSAAGDGRIPFISADEIAQVAFNVLTAKDIENREPYILGPELLSYDEAAKILSEVLGRKIIHKRLPEAESVKFWESFGVENKYSKQLTNLDLDISKGSEENIFFNGEGKIVGKRRLRDYLEDNRELLTLQV